MKVTAMYSSGHPCSDINADDRCVHALHMVHIHSSPRCDEKTGMIFFVALKMVFLTPDVKRCSGLPVAPSSIPLNNLIF